MTLGPPAGTSGQPTDQTQWSGPSLHMTCTSPLSLIPGSGLPVGFRTGTGKPMMFPKWVTQVWVQ